MTFPADIGDSGDFGALEPGRYFIDANVDPVRTLRVEYTLPEGWNSWIGAFRNDPRPDHRQFDASMSIVMITNLVADGCTDHAPSEPVVGPSVEDLADALLELEPFTVAVEPQPVDLAGHSGLYLELEVPESTGFAKDSFGYCADGGLKSWIGPPLSYAYYGYHTAGQHEGFWILDVAGERLVVEALWVGDLLPEARAELHGILDSIDVAETPNS